GLLHPPRRNAPGSCLPARGDAGPRPRLRARETPVPHGTSHGNGQEGVVEGPHRHHAFELGKRRFLMELPTGTGKTDLMALYLKRLLKAGWAERVLFLVDRDQLAKQALNVI